MSSHSSKGVLAIIAVSLAIVHPLSLSAQAPNAPKHSVADSLLDRLVGRWLMTGEVRRHPAMYSLVAARTLGGRYVELHMADTSRTAGYEARVFIGADTAPGRVIVHWIDNTGAAFSVPAGAGAVTGDTIIFDIPYPTGAFRDTFVYARATDSWILTLESADGHGGWQLFARYDVKRQRR